MLRLAQTILASPLGEIRLIANAGALAGVYFAAQHAPAPLEAGTDGHHPVLVQAARELDEYFRGLRQAFSTPLAMRGTTFQRAVWQALTAIPYGERRSYAQIAAATGQPRACRAVGAANARNPLPVFVPCHRVVGADGSLTGYAGGVALKRWLLAHEQAVLAGTSSAYGTQLTLDPSPSAP
jgi:methylated-DNA-[protein]-cysteine S-methyltransferase